MYFLLEIFNNKLLAINSQMSSPSSFNINRKIKLTLLMRKEEFLKNQRKIGRTKGYICLIELSGDAVV